MRRRCGCWRPGNQRFVWSATAIRRSGAPSPFVSIHALRVECDWRRSGLYRVHAGFNPRTPCGVRHAIRGCLGLAHSFNPRTPCGVRLLLGCQLYKQTGFQSTHSVWSATAYTSKTSRSTAVSIHALRVECDREESVFFGLTFCFNPRTPCGVRLLPEGAGSGGWVFQSTHSVWSATTYFYSLYVFCNVSIHALRVECDNGAHGNIREIHGFNPRTPCGVRLFLHPTAERSLKFQSTHSVWSATQDSLARARRQVVSIHALRVECDALPDGVAYVHRKFQSTHSVWSATGNDQFFFDSLVVSIHALRVECDCKIGSTIRA